MSNHNLSMIMNLDSSDIYSLDVEAIEHSLEILNTHLEEEDDSSDDDLIENIEYMIDVLETELQARGC